MFLSLHKKLSQSGNVTKVEGPYRKKKCSLLFPKEIFKFWGHIKTWEGPFTTNQDLKRKHKKFQRFKNKFLFKVYVAKSAKKKVFEGF